MIFQYKIYGLTCELGGMLKDERRTSSPPAAPFMGGVTSTATFELFGMFLSA